MTRDGKRKRAIRRVAREKGVSYSTAVRIGGGEVEKRFWWVNQNQTFDQEVGVGLPLVAQAGEERGADPVL